MARMAMAPATANANGACVGRAAPPVICKGAEVVADAGGGTTVPRLADVVAGGGGAVVGTGAYVLNVVGTETGVLEVVGATTVVGANTVVCDVYETVSRVVEELDAVTSLGKVTVSITGTLVASVMGLYTVALVVGGSVVEVRVKNEVSMVVVLPVAVLSLGIVTVSSTAILVAKVIGTKTVALVVGGSVVEVRVKNEVSKIVVLPVAVLSLGIVIVSSTGTLVAKVIGTRTVALVVGGSRVLVMV